MAAALAEVILKKLGSLAADQANLLWGLKSEIPKLGRTVSAIQAVLLDAEEQANHSRQVKQWLWELKQVLYDAEDLLDDLSTERLRRDQMDGSFVVNEVSTFFSPSNQVVYGLKIANDIKAIRNILDEIDENRKQFNFQPSPVDSMGNNKGWRQTHSSAPDVVVGREVDKQKIVDSLVLSSHKEKVAVVPILGMGGLGKTTLAQQIYNDDQVKNHFDCRYWVCVSEIFEPRLLVTSILESITKNSVADLALETLKDLLHEKIKNKKLLLVLDDVWNEDAEKWSCFISLFSIGATAGSRIIITTRLRTVAEMTAASEIEPHELGILSQPESWSLFEKIAFKGGIAPGPRHVEIGKEIVEKCGGVPLAVRTMGGLLYFKETESEWEAIKGKQLSSVIFGRQDTQVLATTLKLSYDNLPCQLKCCFSYCSLFPKDHEFDVKELIQLWMAQGYIIDSVDLHLEDVGLEYFKNLLWRSFFQEARKDNWGNMTSCKMHDLMHDLAISVAGEETKCLKASDLTDSCEINLERTRHLSVDFGDWPEDNPCQFPTYFTGATKLRTLLLRIPYSQYCRLEGSGGSEMIFSNMRKLRVLSLRNGKMENVKPDIHKLKHLRYLDLYQNRMQMLPEEITRLVNLQVLCLGYCKSLAQLPRNIGKMSNVMYLDVEYCKNLTWMPVGMGKLTHLRELSIFVVPTEAEAAAGVSELKSLNNLSRLLLIQGLEKLKGESEAQSINLKEKSHLQSLQLEWSNTSSGRGGENTVDGCDNDDKWEILEGLQPHGNLKEIRLSGYSGTILSTSWFSSLRNLVQIELFSCEKVQNLPSLNPFVFLEDLTLRDLESLEYVQSGRIQSLSSSSSLPFSNDTKSYDMQYLPSLQSVEIRDCPNLIGWATTTADLPLLPRVSRICIRECPKLKIIPNFLMHFENVWLETVSIELLGELGESISLPTPPAHPRFHSLTLSKLDHPMILLPQGGFLQRLASLERLRLSGCNHITTLSIDILGNLPSLQQLIIKGCGALEFEDYNHGKDDNISLPLLPNLRRFCVAEIPKFVTLPEWLQHSPKLQQLQIYLCHNLKCLPSWLTNLNALESLEVGGCNLLSGRCRCNTAEDWPKIAHIPNIENDFTMIQQGGIYLGVQRQEEEQQLEDQHQQYTKQEASSRTQFSRVLENFIGRLTCNLFQRCFLP